MQEFQKRKWRGALLSEFNGIENIALYSERKPFWQKFLLWCAVFRLETDWRYDYDYGSYLVSLLKNLKGGRTRLKSVSQFIVSQKY